MNEDYLWDKTGEPDPEIERLERVMGTLRYRPRKFELPVEPQARNSRTWMSLVAIAAGIAIAVVAAGVWLAANRPMTAEIARIELPLPYESPSVARPGIAPQSNEDAKRFVRTKFEKARFHRRGSTEQLMAERKEAEQAKEQLLLALRLTSSKLSMAQKKVQGSPGIIRNQHKVG